MFWKRSSPWQRFYTGGSSHWNTQRSWLPWNVPDLKTWRVSHLCVSGVLCSYWWDAGEAAGVCGRKRQHLHLRLHGLQLQTRPGQRAVSGDLCGRYTDTHACTCEILISAPVCLTCLVSQLCLWRWRETAPVVVWSDWQPSQRREWNDESYWETSCLNSPHTEHTHLCEHACLLLFIKSFNLLSQFILFFLKIV